MGLDQYLFAVEGEQKDEVGYWRKHADLQGYVESLWEKAGRPGGEEGTNFNCIGFELTEEHIKSIIECSEKRSFGSADGTTGFFFGQTREQDHEDTVRIMKAALELHKQGKKIVYDSWW